MLDPVKDAPVAVPPGNNLEHFVGYDYSEEDDNWTATDLLEIFKEQRLIKLVEVWHVPESILPSLPNNLTQSLD